MDALDCLEDEDFQLVYQLSRGKRLCDLCRSDKHLLYACPELLKVKTDKFRVKRLLGALKSQSTSGRPSGSSTDGTRDSTPTRANRPDVPVRQALLDNGDTDDDTIDPMEECSLGGDTDDESKD